MWWLSLIAVLSWAKEPPPGGWPDPPETATVTEVYDGDTITLGTADKVRLRWVNTPELRPLEPYGLEAKEAASRFCKGETVTLVTPTIGDVRDGYGRILSGVRLQDGSDLSIHLLEQGLGHVFIIPPEDADIAPLLEAQGRARAANRGIWSTDRYKGDLHITSFHANAPGDDNENVNGEYLRIANVSQEAVNVSGWRITRSTGQSYEWPDLTIPAGHTVKVFSGKGEHQKNAAMQLEIYLDSSRPIWNNSGDKATVYDRFGRVSDAREHKVKGR